MGEHAPALRTITVDLLQRLQNVGFFVSIAESETVWGYPTVLVLHTIGFALVVGSTLIVNARLLGLGRRAPLPLFSLVFPIMWAGFTLNAVTGFILFAIAATMKAAQIVFWIKLALIAVALVATTRIARIIRGSTVESSVPVGARRLAVVSLVAWTGTIIAGRLMAYIK
jgi:hypothetical protein